MILIPTQGPGGTGPKKGLGIIVEDTKEEVIIDNTDEGDIVNKTREEGLTVLSEGDTNSDIVENPNGTNNSETPEEGNITTGDKILSLEEELLSPDGLEIEPAKEIVENATEKEKKEISFLLGIREKIGSVREAIFPKSREVLNDMIEAGIITQKEMDAINKELKIAEVKRSINTRKWGQGASIGYMFLNMGVIFPQTTIAFGPGYGILAFLACYALKRLYMGIIIRIAGRKLENINNISKKTTLPIVGAHMPLFDLAKRHTLAAEYLFKRKKIPWTWKRIRFKMATDEETKKQRGIEWKEKDGKQKEWFEKKIAWLDKPRKEIIREQFEATGKTTPAWQIERARAKMSPQEINSVIKSSIIEYKNKKIQGENNPARPEMRIDGIKWQFDKSEPGMIEIQEENHEKIFKIQTKTGDILQINNTQIYDDTLKENAIKELKLGDKASERTELQDRETFELGKAYRFSFDFKIPEDFPIIDNRLVLGQWKQKAAKDSVNSNPLIAQRFRNGQYAIGFNNTGDPKGETGNKLVGEKIEAKELLGKRIHAEYEINFSEHNDGYVIVKHNGNTIWEFHGKTSSSSEEYPVGEYYENKFYFKFGLYKDNYEKRLMELRNEENNEENIKKIKAIEQAQENENKGNPMTIYFKNYSANPIG